ncbi:MAG: EamA family transporter RarD [Bdellovibrionaceae bacterium]|nr:EamA family transporter RarD [Bdellovibrionales bacterium]MCB9254372.1 EamA family transporter RarD [Pseudobdellovibrionaceae bacterium]
MRLLSNGNSKPSEARIGLAYSLLAYFWWGFAALFWKRLTGVAPLEILAHRILWSFIFLIPLFFKQRVREQCASVFEKGSRDWIYIVLGTVLIGFNWGAFILAMVTERILEASLGYFIAPLTFVGLGVWFLHERLNRNQRLAVLLATVAISLLWFRLGTLPWIALCLAFTFTFYGLFKRKISIDASLTVAFETGLLSLPALAYLYFYSTPHNLMTWALLIASGPVTLLPQVWFTLGARRVPFTVMGFLQYIAPMMNFLIALFIYHEPFDEVRMLTFGLIWVGLLIYTADMIARRRTATREAKLKSA